MSNFPTQVKKSVCHILIWLGLLGTLSCARLDPRKVSLDLKNESPGLQKTMFYETLGLLGAMSEVYESKPVKIQCMTVIDDTGSSLATHAEIPQDMTEMLKSALNSIGGRITYIPYIPNYVANQISIGQITSLENISVPDIVLTGGITEFDRGLETEGKNIDLSAEGTFKNQPLGVDYATALKASIGSITFDLNLIDFQTMAGIPRMQATNSIKVHKAVSEKELAFSLFGPTFGLKGTIKKIQGRHEAVRLLVQLSVIQIVGRYLKLPYWKLLPNAEPDPEVIRTLKADYKKMELSQRIAAIQKLLILNGYVVPVTGVLDNPTNVALQTFYNKYDPYRQNIDENLFLNMYLSVPLELAATKPIEINDFKPPQNKLSENNYGFDAPSVDVIVDALVPISDNGQGSRTRGAAGKRDIQQENFNKPVEIDLQIPFDFNQYTISHQATPYLQRLGNAMTDARLKGSIFEIQGHTCNQGRADYNLWLSQKRAEALKDYIISHFNLSPNQLKAIGYGMERPKWTNETEEGRAKNRRVTIVNTLKKNEKTIARPSLNIYAHYLRMGKEKELRPGTALSSRDNYSLSFTADQACYVYVFQIDSQNTVTQLFPNSDFSYENNPIAPEKSYRVPDSGKGWLFLDENTGEEELIVLAYSEPLADPLRTALSLIGYYESRLFPFQDDEERTTRGPKGIRQAPDDILFVWRNKFTHIE